MPAMLYMTAPDRRTALRIAERLVRDRLVACANVWEARSVYRWRGKVVRAGEAVAVMKTSDRRVAGAIRAARKLHPDRVPCLVAYRMATGLPEYLRWVSAETR
jgi:periplasmic divalent cation tolerance protein